MYLKVILLVLTIFVAVNGQKLRGIVDDARDRLSKIGNKISDKMPDMTKPENISPSEPVDGEESLEDRVEDLEDFRDSLSRGVEEMPLGELTKFEDVYVQEAFCLQEAFLISYLLSCRRYSS